MSCKDQRIERNTFICAKICDKFNDSPIASYTCSGSTLNDASIFFDDGTSANREYKWTFFVENVLFYEFDWGLYNNQIVELNNGSTYDKLIVGEHNEDLFSFFDTLPFTIIEDGTTFHILLEVMDNTGIVNKNTSNKYYFTK